MIDLSKHILSNGLTVLVHENHRLPICTVMIWFRIGSRHERPGITGMSHFLEHCYSMGTTRFKPRENSWIIQRLGGTKNAFTSRDTTAYYSNVPSEHLALILDLEADRLKNLALPEPNVLSEKEVIKEEKRLRYDDSPFGKMYETLYEMAYHDHPYQHPVIGRWEDLEAMTREDMWQYYRGTYAPGNIVISVAGDVTDGTVSGLVGEYFGDVPASGKNPPDAPDLPDVATAHRTVIRKESDLFAILMGYPCVAVDHPDYAALTMTAAVLSAGRSSRLYQKLIFESHLATFASASFEAMAGPALFQIMAQAQPDHAIAEVEKAIDAELNRLQTEGVPGAEWDRVRNQVEADFVFALETNEQRAEWMGRYEVISARHGAEFVNRLLPMLLEVRPEDVVRVTGEYLTADRRCVVVLDPIRKS